MNILDYIFEKVTCFNLFYIEYYLNQSLHILFSESLFIIPKSKLVVPGYSSIKYLHPAKFNQADITLLQKMSTSGQSNDVLNNLLESLKEKSGQLQNLLHDYATLVTIALHCYIFNR